MTRSREIASRVARLDWDGVARDLDDRGHALTPAILSAGECRALAALWRRPERFRHHVDMARFRLGAGEYRYFADPLPPLVVELRREAYTRLAPIANRWAAVLGEDQRYPEELATFLARCAAQRQRQPTPLLLRYGAGGYNCLHQDLYGPIAFPLQLTVLLDRPGIDFSGGEFLLVEQRPRAQSRGQAIVLEPVSYTHLTLPTICSV